MDEFSPIGTNAPMSSDETPKIEPTLTVTDAPSIAPETKSEPAKSEAAEAPKAEAAPEIKIEVKAETAKIEPMLGPSKLEPQIEAPTLPQAAQIEPPKFIMATHR